MSFLELVKARRSCRQYSSRLVARESLQRCLEAARLAPSACNSQPWFFIVIDDALLKEELARLAFSGIYKMNSFAGQAPVLVAMVRENSSYAARLGGTFRGVVYSLIDLGIAGEHFCLQAQEEGLGTCWLGWFNEKAVKKILRIPRDRRVDALISVGFPEEGFKAEKNRKTLHQMSEFR